MVRKPFVGTVEKTQDARHLCCRVERPRPPDLARETNNGFGAAENLAFRGNDAHFAKQFFWGKIDEDLHARVLQGGETEVAFFQCATEEAGQRGAHAAVSVEANPASRGLPSFYISNF